MSKLYVVGIGPGEVENWSFKAHRILERVDKIVGYKTYVELVAREFPEQDYWQSGMRGEIERCKQALSFAQEGLEVAMVCSGDAGIYGMAGLCLELLPQYPGVEVEVVAGITAASSGAALLGSPLSNDFAVISLSDLLTPWAVIEKRLRAAAEGDFVTVLYNPGSKKRREHLARAAAFFLEVRPADTLCGICHKIGREGESFQLCSLEALAEKEVDMFTTVFIGNSQSKNILGHMVTQRGYEQKREARA